jgi:dihydropteroate synthase
MSDRSRVLDCAGKPLALDQPAVMGVLNVTPDSFSDGGDFIDLPRAVARAVEMAEQGVSIVDVGGESTRPGAPEISVQQELDRVLPVIEVLHSELPIPLSIDTSKPEVMRAAITAGAGFINDVNALRSDQALEVAAATTVPICLMHMQGSPRTMQQEPQYDSVVDDILTYLAQRISACEKAGIPRDRLIIDPGFGFGKTLEHNLALLAGLDRFHSLGLPILVGISRKSMLGALTGRPVEQRLAASLAAAVLAVERGADILRVHDVGETVDALKVANAVRAYRVMTD